MRTKLKFCGGYHRKQKTNIKNTAFFSSNQTALYALLLPSFCDFEFFFFLASLPLLLSLCFYHQEEDTVLLRIGSERDLEAEVSNLGENSQSVGFLFLLFFFNN